MCVCGVHDQCLLDASVGGVASVTGHQHASKGQGSRLVDLIVTYVPLCCNLLTLAFAICLVASVV